MRRAPLLTVVLAVAAAACAGTQRASATPGTAVVVYEPGRAADAAAAREALVAQGWRAETAPSGPARRTRSSLALYGRRKPDARGGGLADVLRPVAGEFDVLPFLTDGPGRHDAVLWLAEGAAPEVRSR